MTAEPFPIDAYLQRIGLTERPPVDADGLRRVHAGQLRAVPFENLDILMDRGLQVSREAIAEKLIDQRRGGYCFENNSLLRDALVALGPE